MGKCVCGGGGGGWSGPKCSGLSRVRVTEFQAEWDLDLALPVSRAHPGIRAQLVNWGVRVSWVVIKIRITTGSEPGEGRDHR